MLEAGQHLTEESRFRKTLVEGQPHSPHAHPDPHPDLELEPHSGLRAVFRLQSNASAAFEAFIQSDRDEAVVTLAPTDDARRQQPETDWRPQGVRLVKCTAGKTVFSSGTTLLDAEFYRGPDFARLYHGRWRIEECFKISRNMLVVEEFRSRSERLVRRELYAHFTLAALSRLFANYSEEAFREGPDGRPCWPTSATRCKRWDATSKGPFWSARKRWAMCWSRFWTGSGAAARGGVRTAPICAVHASRRRSGGNAR